VANKSYQYPIESDIVQKNEATHSLRPVTIGQLRNATQAHTDADWMIENNEIGQVRQFMSNRMNTPEVLLCPGDSSCASHFNSSSNHELCILARRRIRPH
jgi:replication factor A2